MRCLIIAEAGVNHNGSEELALELVEAAHAAGADAVKFQTFRAEQLVRAGAPKAAYQERETGGGDQLSMLRSLELPASAYSRLCGKCRALNLEFLSTPFDEQSADVLVELGMGRLKVPSGEVTNFPLLAYLAGKALPIILSTGMADLDEVGEAVSVIRQGWKRTDVQELPGMLTLLHCTSNYPTAMQDVNLRAMLTMAEHFHLPVGYSDHTAGIEVPIAAVALGAAVIEKHFTLDHALPGPDHKASLQPAEFARMVRAIRDVECAMGDGVKKARPAELPVRDLVRRSITLIRPVTAGARIEPEDVALLRPGTGIPPSHWAEIIGRAACRDLPAGTTLRWEDLKP